MLSFCFMIYILICFINLYYDSSKIPWVICLVYFVVSSHISFNDWLFYIVSQYLLQAMMLSLLLFYYSPNKLYVEASIILALLILCLLLLFNTTYISDISWFLYLVSDNFSYEAMLLVSTQIRKEDIKTYYPLTITLLILSRTY